MKTKSKKADYCSICGKTFENKEKLSQHLKDTVCSSVDISKPLACSFTYTQAETGVITLPVKVTLRLTIEKIEALKCESAQRKFIRTDNEQVTERTQTK